jgi:hypothetical protein
VGEHPLWVRGGCQSEEERDRMSNLQLDWSTAEVSDGKLSVSLDERPSDEWTASFERTAQLLDRGTWPDIKLKKREITVKAIEAGDEERLRFFLESVVQEANAAAGSDDQEESEASADPEPEETGSDREPDPDREMTERFRGFADAPAEQESSSDS